MLGPTMVLGNDRSSALSPQQLPTCVYCMNGPDIPADTMEFKNVTYKLVIWYES
jgi:hypothetical protein